MGVLFDYFSARSDEDAAGVLDKPRGPRSNGPAQGDATGPAFDVLPVTGVDPVVQMGTLEGLLTGRSFEEVMAGPRAGHVLASKPGGERVVVALTDELQAVLAGADEARLNSVAVPWSQTEEFFGRGNPEVLARLLGELASLARRADASGQRLYCPGSL